jgi:hypothetical protein
MSLYRAADLEPDTATGRAGRLVRLCLGHVDVALNLIQATHYDNQLPAELFSEGQALLGLGGMVPHRAQIEQLLAAAVDSGGDDDIVYLLSLTEEAAEGLEYDHFRSKIQHAEDPYEAVSWLLRYKRDLQGMRVFLAHVGWHSPAIEGARQIVASL